MATAALSGKDGSVDIGGAVSEARNWEIELTSEAQDATTYDSSGWREFIAGLKGGSGTFESLNARLAVGAHATGTFAISGGPSIEGALHIDSYKPGVPVDGVVMYTYAFTFSGKITSS